jgi:hypothetical protein
VSLPPGLLPQNDESLTRLRTGRIKFPFLSTAARIVRIEDSFQVRSCLHIEGLVMLIIILACLAKRVSSPIENGTSKSPNEMATQTPSSKKFQAVYVVSQHSFSEIDDFVSQCSAEYHLEVASYRLPMKKALESFLAERPSLRAIFVGTRRTDPHAENLKHFDPTDAGWPDVMRVHPVIDWHYGSFSNLDVINDRILILGS